MNEEKVYCIYCKEEIKPLRNAYAYSTNHKTVHRDIEGVDLHRKCIYEIAKQYVANLKT